MRNIALRIAYDGTDFVGSQWQNDGRSVQAALEEAWLQLTQERRRFTLAGRTDAGVHALGQVANVLTETRHSVPTVLRGMNAWLPSDLVVQAVAEVDAEFHARYTATQRAYRYLIDTGNAPVPMLRHCVLHYTGALDTAAMAAALQVLEGTHDFASFAAQSPGQKTTVRTMHAARLQIVELFGRPLVAIDLSANAFLQHMVRVIVGTVLLVGRGKLSVADFQQILHRRDRRAAGPTAAAHGLTLMAVQYPAQRLRWTDMQSDGA
jgi:tRNA pseudouridine38-40 synthase